MGLGLPQRLQTDRLILRRHRRGDAPAIAEALNDWEVVRWLSRLPNPYTKTDAADWISVATRNWNQGRDYQFVVTRAADGALVGHMGVRPDEAGVVCEFGYWFARPSWGQGYATEAGRAVLGFAFDRLDMHTVEALVIPDNERSVRVLDKLGMVPADMRWHRFDPIDATLEVPVYTMTRARWREGRAA
jgi:8-oxo-dGTP diphosphatase